MPNSTCVWYRPITSVRSTMKLADKTDFADKKTQPFVLLSCLVVKFAGSSSISTKDPELWSRRQQLVRHH